MKKFWLIGFVITMLIGLSGCRSIESFTQGFLDGLSGPTSNNEAGTELMRQGEIEEAIKAFKNALESGEDEATTYNNLSWAHNELYEFETALYYIEKAYKLDKEDSVIRVNYGNSLYGLNRLEEAEEQYQKAISLNEDEKFAYYGLASVYMDIYDYEQAEANLLTYLKYDDKDLKAQLKLSYCYFYQNQLMKSYDYINELIELYPNDFDVWDMKGYILEFIETEANVVSYYEEMQAKFPESHEAWMNIGLYQYTISNYNKAIAAFEAGSIHFPEDSYFPMWLSSSYSMMGKMEQALNYANKALELEKNSDSYNNMGNILFDSTDYLGAADYYQLAIDHAEYLDEDYYTNIIYAYYLANRYQKSVDYGLSALELLPYSYDIPWVMTYGYQELGEYDKAIEVLELAVKRGLDETLVVYEIAENYYYKGDYDKTQDYIDLALSSNPDDYDALYLQETLDLKRSGSENIVRSIFNDYYLYEDKINPIYTILEFKDLGYQETEDLFYQLTNEEDQYTFYLYGDVYDYMLTDESSSIECSLLDSNTALVTIYFFNESTDHLFIEFIDTLENPEEMTLIINVIDNSGGVTDSAVHILDSLLPAVTVSSLIDRTGYSYPYYTSASYMSFEHIYILQNENSASAAELLTLGLDTFLPNVTIVGENSHGKGVGQLYFDEPNKKAAYFIVNHYWNVREINIMGVGIKPDIYLEVVNLENCLEAIR